jgi:meso-butanediol dehydrogenase/(S,S)-butanediol dehydrogenase/diacetyl reductase
MKLGTETMGKLPLEIAHSVACLLSDMSTAITGTAFVVDGGVLAGA